MSKSLDLRQPGTIQSSFQLWKCNGIIFNCRGGANLSRFNKPPEKVSGAPITTVRLIEKRVS